MPISGLPTGEYHFGFAHRGIGVTGIYFAAGQATGLALAVGGRSRFFMQLASRVSDLSYASGCRA